ncbi:dynein heavy chain domain-containing 1, partial [Pelobates cultripes]
IQSLCSFLDDSLLSLRMMKVFPLSCEMQDDIQDWIQKLEDLDYNLGLWIQFQEKWVFIMKVLHEMEVPLLFSDNKMTQFQMVDQDYRSFLNKIVQDPRVMSFLGHTCRRHEQNLRKTDLGFDFHKGISVMEETLGEVKYVLDSSRSLFYRFFFLGDKDLLSVLSAPAEPRALTQCALICFPSLRNVLYQAQTTQIYETAMDNSHILATGIEGNCGERLNLRFPICGSLSNTSWLSMLDQELRESVRSQLELCLSEYRKVEFLNLKNSDLSKQWSEHLTIYPWQCLAVSQEVLWCEQVEAHIFSHQGALLRERYNKKLEILVQVLRDSYRALGLPKEALCQRQAVLSSWIMLCSQQRDRINTLLKGKIDPLESFSWAKMIKYRALAEPECRENKLPSQVTANVKCLGDISAGGLTPLVYFVEILRFQFPYEYEYIGLESGTIYGTFSDRSTLGLILALKQYQCGTVIGQDEESRIHTVVALGKALGRHIVILKCWGGIDLGRLSQHLHGALQGNAWLILDGAHRLKRDVQSLLGQLLCQIQSSCYLLKFPGGISSGLSPLNEQFLPKVIGHIQFEGRTVSVGRSYGCFMTLPNLNSSSELPSNLCLVLRPVSLLTPDLRFTAKLALLTAGFQKTVCLARKISCFFQLVQDSGLVSPISCCLLVNRAIHLAASFMRATDASERTNNGDSMQLNGGIASITTPQAHTEQHFTQSRTPDSQEESSLIKAINASPFWSGLSTAEINYLRGILQSIFPICPPMEPCNEHFGDTLLCAIKLVLQESGLEAHAGLDCSAQQLFNALQHSTGVLLTGCPGSGKTTCWRILSHALSHLASCVEQPGATEEKNFSCSHQTVQTEHLFPNSFTINELYGEMHDRSWRQGIFSSILSRVPQDHRAQKWLVLDGSSSPHWAEPISFLFGSYPALTLSNGEHLQLPESIKILFEMADTSNITPAMSTLCSFVHCGGENTWRAILAAFKSKLYLKYRLTLNTLNLLQSLSDSLVPSTLVFLESSCTSALYPHTAQSAYSMQGVQEVSSFCNILQALLDQYLLQDHVSSKTFQPQEKAQDLSGETQVLGDHREDPRDHAPTKAPTDAPTEADHTNKPVGEVLDLSSFDQYISPLNHHLALSCFVYSFIWGFAGHLDPKHRPQFEIFLRGILSDCLLQVDIPLNVSIFDISLNPEAGVLVPCPSPPTLMESIRSNLIIPQFESIMVAARSLVCSGLPVLLVGPPGCGKTSLAQTVTFHGALFHRIPINSLLRPGHLRQHLNTHHENATAVRPRSIIHGSRLRHLFLLDDLHKASFDSFSKTCPVLETLRGIISDPANTACVPLKSILGTTCSPQDGAGALCPRLTRLFCILVLPELGPESLLSVFTLHLTTWLKKTLSMPHALFLGKAIGRATVNLYNKVIHTIPPHYCFSLHHIHRLINSITLLCSAPGPHLSPHFQHSLPAALLTTLGIVRLWMHEALRTFGDILEDDREKLAFSEHLLMCAVQEFCPLGAQDGAPEKSHPVAQDGAPEKNQPGSQDGAMVVDQLGAQNRGLEMNHPENNNQNMCIRDGIKHEISDRESEQIRSQERTADAPCTSHTSTNPSANEEYLLPSYLLNETPLQDLTFSHSLVSGTQQRGELPTYKEQSGSSYFIKQSAGLILCPQDLQHIVRLTRVLVLPQGHLALCSQCPATGRRSLAKLAAQLTQCSLVELCGKEMDDERYALYRKACYKASVLGGSTAFLVHEGAPIRFLIELSALISEGTILGLHNADQEDQILKDLQQRERSRNKRYNKETLRERFCQRVRRYLHVLLLQNISQFSSVQKCPLYQFLNNDQYEPWSLHSLQHIAQKLLGEEHQTPEHQPRDSLCSSLSISERLFMFQTVLSLGDSLCPSLSCLWETRCVPICAVSGRLAMFQSVLYLGDSPCSSLCCLWETHYVPVCAISGRLSMFQIVLSLENSLCSSLSISGRLAIFQSVLSLGDSLCSSLCYIWETSYVPVCPVSGILVVFQSVLSLGGLLCFSVCFFCETCCFPVCTVFGRHTMFQSFYLWETSYVPVCPVSGRLAMFQSVLSLGDSLSSSLCCLWEILFMFQSVPSWNTCYVSVSGRPAMLHSLCLGNSLCSSLSCIWESRCFPVCAVSGRFSLCSSLSCPGRLAVFQTVLSLRDSLCSSLSCL